MAGQGDAGRSMLVAFWPAVAVLYGLAIPAFLGLAEFTIDWLTAVLLLGLVAVGLGLAWIGTTVVSIRTRRYRRVIAALLAPGLGWLVAALWAPLQPGLQLRLLVDQPAMQHDLARSAALPGHRHLLAGWGDAGSPIEGPLRIYTLIYDEDGTVANEAYLRATYGENGPLTLRHIRGDYFLMTQFP